MGIVGMTAPTPMNKMNWERMRRVNGWRTEGGISENNCSASSCSSLTPFGVMTFFLFRDCCPMASVCVELLTADESMLKNILGFCALFPDVVFEDVDDSAAFTFSSSVDNGDINNSVNDAFLFLAGMFK